MDRIKKEQDHLQELLKEIREVKRVLLIGTFVSGGERSVCEEQLDELQRLSETYGLSVIEKVSCPLKRIDAGTFLGNGKLDELLSICLEKEIHLILFDDDITPHQQRNLEKFFRRPVIDRTELIIEVFAQRAQTREARLQVELAQIKYQMPRLKRLWTHLSRQRTGGGGGGYLRGAGETQIEMDRRTLRRRILQLEEEIKTVRSQRETQRSGRKRSGIPTFAIVGYTNAGKSSLLKALTKAEVLVEDKLFATLDTTTRKFVLPNRQEVLLIDTVGFIRKLPHALVAAFKSTLEEAVHADILLHLVDISHPSAEVHAATTNEVLVELGAVDRPIITVLNKIDLCQDPSVLHRFRIKYPKTVPISVATKEGFEELVEMMMQELSSLRKQLVLRIPQSHYVLVSELMREGRVIRSEYEGNDILLEVEIPRRLEYKVLPFVFGTHETKK